MRIVIDLQCCQNGSRLRGIGRYALAITRALLSVGAEHEILIAVSDRFPGTIGPLRRQLSDIIAPERIVVFSVPAHVSGADESAAWRSRAAEALREHFIASLRPDVVFLPSLFEGFWDDCVTSIGRQPLPTAVSIHDLIPLVWPNDFVSGLSERACYNRKLLCLKRADVWLAVSDYSRAEALELLDLPPERVLNTSEAAEARFRPAELGAEAESALRARLGIALPFVMFSSAMEQRKNVTGLVRAYGALPRDIRLDHRLVLVGGADDHFRRHLATVVADAGLAPDEVVLTGHVTDDELVALYSLCRVFVFPSFHEGFGLPVLEAMSCGAPVIGSSVTSIPEVIGRGDALFDPADTTAMSALLARVLTDAPFRTALSAYGLRRAREFSWDVSARRALAGFETLRDGRANEKGRGQGAGRPRLAYVTRLPPDPAPRAVRATALAPELARHYDVEFVCDQHHLEAPWLTANFPVHSTAWFEAHAKDFTRILYDLGGPGPMDFGLMARHPGAVIVDQLFPAETRPDLDDRNFLAWLYEAHGFSAVALAADQGRLAAAAAYPMTSSLLAGSLGVLVTSEEVREAAAPWLGRAVVEEWRVLPLGAEPPRGCGGARTASDLAASAIETFVVHGPPALEARLFADITAPCGVSPSEEDLVSVARCLAANSRQAGRGRLLIDIGAPGRRGANSQRPALRQIAELIRKDELGRRIEPIYAEGHGFRHARTITLEALGVADLAVADEPVTAWAGDVYLALSPLSASAGLVALRERGVTTLSLASELPSTRDHDGAVAFDPAMWTKLRAAFCASERAPPHSVACAARDLRYTVRGHVLGTYSLALINRAAARALERAHPGAVRLDPFENGVVHSLADVPAEEREMAEVLARRPPPGDGRRIVISQHYPVIAPEVGAADLSIALTAWEESVAPRAFVDDLSTGFDAVLATSRFTAKALIDSGLRRPVISIGQPPDTSAFVALGQAPRPSSAPFVFLHVSSAMPRKGLDVLLAAYGRAFRRTDPVLLVIKTFPNPHNDIETRLADWARRFPDGAEIESINRDLERADLVALYARAGAVVCPSRGEGYNLPAIEAMTAGIPLIVTGYGGHRDFCGESEARQLRYRLERSSSHVGAPHGLWAEPDEDDLVAALREMVDPAQAPAIAARAARARGAALAAASPSRWVARLDEVAARLLADRRDMPPRTAWVSTWNIRCGIAEYSRLLLDAFSPAARAAVSILADTRTPRGCSGGQTATPTWTMGAAGAWMDIAEAIARVNPHAVVIQHQDGLLPWPDLTELLEDARLVGRVTVVTLHNAVQLAAQAKAEQAVVARGLRRASRVHVHTVADVNLLATLGVADNVTFLPHGAARAPELPEVRDLRPKGIGPIIGCHGFFLPGKGIDQLIRACAILRRSWPNLTLRLVNARFPADVSDHEIERCRQVAREVGLADVIEWRTAFLPQAAITEALSGCDLIVMAYEQRSDSASGAVRGALGSLAPVMVTPVDIFRELGDAVERLPSDEPEAMAVAIADVLANIGRRRDIQARAASWLETHAWPAVAFRLEGMIHGLVASNPLGADKPAAGAPAMADSAGLEA